MDGNIGKNEDWKGEPKLKNYGREALGLEVK